MDKNEPQFKHFNRIRSKLHKVVFETDTPAGKLFDVVLLWAILISIVIVMLESVDFIKSAYGDVIWALEWIFTVLFTIEYAIRIFISKKPGNYISSTLGIIDLIALLPTYLAIFLPGGSYLLVVRGLRLLRVFRILKLTRYLREAEILGKAMRESKRKILIFMGAVSTLMIITGTVMYLIEGGENGFTSIPRSIYWAVVTVTTVGYGDIIPQTILGQAFATLMMLTGYAIIAVPTGIMTSELSKLDSKPEGKEEKTCQNCQTNNTIDSNYCRNCGTKFEG